MLDVTTNGSKVGLGRFLSKFGLCAVYVFFAYSHIIVLRQTGFRLSLVLLVVFETVMIGVVFFRRDSTEVDFSMVAVFAGLVGSFSGLGFRPSGSE